MTAERPNAALVVRRQKISITPSFWTDCGHQNDLPSPPYLKVVAVPVFGRVPVQSTVRFHPQTAYASRHAFYPEETHDVRLIRQSWGSIEQCIPYEVKPNDGLTRDRYRSAFVRGRVELMMPSATQPLDLALYMEEEENGTISAEHYAELNEITSRVLRQAVDYTNSLSLGDKAINAVA